MLRGPPGATELDFAVNVGATSLSPRSLGGTGSVLLLTTTRGLPRASGPTSPCGTCRASFGRSTRSSPTLHSAPAREARRDGSRRGSRKAALRATAEERRRGLPTLRHVVSYLYARGEGYLHSVKRAPAFRVVATTLKRAKGQSTIVIVSDLETTLARLPRASASRHGAASACTSSRSFRRYLSGSRIRFSRLRTSPRLTSRTCGGFASLSRSPT